ncbi:MAG: response regulator [Candidatus Omnitrophica bacterium]|nr:response regulator [Candidatus Omnitrophota bacterium]
MKGKILVVDDEWSIQELLKNVLSLSGFEVVIAANAAEFREQVFLSRPDVIILDIMLGDSDGTQVYKQLLAEGLDVNIPVIFLSALAQDRPSTPPRSDRKYALIGKPFDPDELIRQLDHLVAS